MLYKVKSHVISIALSLSCKYWQAWRMAMTATAAVDLGIIIDVGIGIGVKKPLFIKEEKI